jgi:hypothetical protein
MCHKSRKCQQNNILTSIQNTKSQQPY